MEAKRHVAGPLRRIVLAATLAAFLVSLSGLRSPVVAVTAPPYSHSWYVTDPSNAAMTALGASDAAFDNSHCTEYSMYFRGVLSTTVGNSPSNAWLDLWNTLNADGVGQTSLEAVSKIAYQ
jgi:hypothetical protein